MEPAGLDVLAAKKREEATRSASNGRGGSSALGKRPREMLDEEDGGGPSESGREGLSGQQRQYRTHRLETPSHPGAQHFSTSIRGDAARVPGVQVKAMPAAYMHIARAKPPLDPTQVMIIVAAEQPAPAQSQYTLQSQLEDNGASHCAGGVNEAARDQIDGRRRERGKEGIHASTAKCRHADSRSRHERDRDRERHRDIGRDSRWGNCC